MSRARRRSSGSQAGFSVVEALVSMAIFLFVLLAVFTTYTPNREIQARGETRVDVQQNARLALAEMAREIRMAGYFPENFASPPANPQLASGIRLATNDTLAVYGDTNGSGASTVSLFCITGGQVRKGRAGVAQVAAYTCSSGQIIAESATNLEFRYYDENNNPVPSPPAATFQLDSQAPGAVPNMANSTLRDSVRKIAITLTTTGDSSNRDPQVYALTSEVTLRNAN
jgi:Tfp pilus assembly protein PilW